MPPPKTAVENALPVDSSTATIDSSTAMMDSSPPSRPWWRQDRYIALLFFAVIMLVYSRAWNGAFVWDDDSYISKNPALRTVQGLWQIWFQPWAAGHQYYPISFTGFWIGWHLWGMHTLGYHLVSISLHAVASVLLWQILKRLKVPGSLLGAALFALHPVNVMSVAWMNEMKNTLSCSIALGAVWAYLRFESLGVYAGEVGTEKSKSKSQWRCYALMLVLFLFAMLAKTAVSFLPVSLGLILWWQRDRVGWRDFLPLLPMFGIVAGMGLLTISVEHTTSGATGKDFTVPFLERLVVSGHSFFFYLWKLVFPVNLTFVYPRWEIHPWALWQYLWPLAAAAVLVGFWRWRRVTGKGTWAALMHFYISTSFLVFMVVLYRMRYSFVADHWIYFGSMSMFAWLGAGLAKAVEGLGGWSNAIARRLAVGLFVLLGAMSWWQCGMYKNLDTLWRWTIARNPACWMAENNLGNELLNAGHVDESIGHLQRAMALKSDYVLAMNNLGNAFMQKHRVDDAVALYKTALALKPDNAETLNNLGYAYQQKGRVVEAIGLYEKAVGITPAFALVRNNLASAYLHEGRTVDAINFYLKTLEIAPDDVAALNNLAYLRATSRDSNLRDGVKALEYSQKAVQLTGGSNPVLIDTMAAAYAEQGRYSEAIATDWNAIAQALALKNTSQANLFKKHLGLYQSGKSLRDR